MATYRIRVTEYTDVEADSAAQAVEQFNNDISRMLDNGGALDTVVSIVTEDEATGEETETDAA